MSTIYTKILDDIHKYGNYLDTTNIKCSSDINYNLLKIPVILMTQCSNDNINNIDKYAKICSLDDDNFPDYLDPLYNKIECLNLNTISFNRVEDWEITHYAHENDYFIAKGIIDIHLYYKSNPGLGIDLNKQRKCFVYLHNNQYHLYYLFDYHKLTNTIKDHDKVYIDSTKKCIIHNFIKEHSLNIFGDIYEYQASFDTCPNIISTVSIM